MVIKFSLLITFLLINVSKSIDFTTIGQKEIVDYIKNRADILYGTKLSERNLQDLISNAMFTGLEEEALTFAYGKSVKGKEPVDLLSNKIAILSFSLDGSGPLKIRLTSKSSGTTNIATGGLTTTESSSTKQSVGDFVVNCSQRDNWDYTFLDGSIEIDLGESTDSQDLALIKTVYIAAEVNVTSLSSFPSNEGKLLSLLESKNGSMYIVTYQSLIRETIKSEQGDLFSGLKTNGTVLVVQGSAGTISLAGRTISGKIEPTWEDDVDVKVDTFLTINGIKSREQTESLEQINVESTDLTRKSYTISKNNQSQNLLVTGFNLFDWLFGSHHKHDRHRHHDDWLNGKDKHRNNNGESRNQNDKNRNKDHNKGPCKGWRRSSNWEPSSADGSTWPSWRLFWAFGYGYRCGSWRPKCEDKQSGKTTSTTTPKPSTILTPSTAKSVPSEVTTTSQPIETFSPEITTEAKSEPVTLAEETKWTDKNVHDLSDPELSDLPKGTTVTIWSTKLII